MTSDQQNVYSRQPDENQIFLTGELADEPKYRTIAPNDMPVANVKILTVSKFFTTKENRRTSLINLVFYGPYTDLARPLKKGSRVFLRGELHIRPTSTTHNSTTTEIIVQSLHPLQDETTQPQNSSTTADVAKWG